MAIVLIFDAEELFSSDFILGRFHLRHKLNFATIRLDKSNYWIKTQKIQRNFKRILK